MNREQYLAKRMWLHGIPHDAGRAAQRCDRCGDVRPAPAAASPSLAEHYRRFHACPACADGKDKSH